MLEALAGAPEEFVANLDPHEAVFRLFHLRHGGESDSGTTTGGLIGSLSLHSREALLLTVIEGFSIDQTAAILGSSTAAVTAQIEQARSAISTGLHSKVMIIEDETIIALDIKAIVESLGHEVTGIARTRSEATALATATRPELILADISLADGSSGIGAVNDIMVHADLPVIFITAFPERLLTGERPEPTYLITKPFSPETVAATIGQALLFHREQASRQSIELAPSDADGAPDPRSQFASPHALASDPAMGTEEKAALLTDWDTDLSARLDAEAEGMGGTDTLSSRSEGRLLDETAKVKGALREVSDQTPSA
jgi:CheY-like chemotaxis protein